MPRPPLSEEQLGAMRGRILDAAYAILLKDGPNGLTSRAIAEALGVAHMTLFTYFANQAAILEALAEREMAKIGAQQESFERQASDGDVAHVMRDALAFYPRFAAENPALFQLAWTMSQTGHGEAARGRTQRHVLHLSRLVQIGIARSVFQDRDPTLAAAAVFGMITFPLVMFYSGRISSPLMRDAVVGEMLDAALLYLTHAPLPGGAPRGGPAPWDGPAIGSDPETDQEQRDAPGPVPA